MNTLKPPAASESPLDMLYQRPGFLLRRAHQLSVALFDLHCGALNLTPPQYGVLTVLSHAQGIDQATLAKALGFDKVTTLHIVRGLEARGLLSRLPDANDRRRMTMRLTKSGTSLLARSAPGASQAYAELMAPLKPREQAQLLALLGRLCDDLEPHARAPMHKLRA